MMMMIMMIMYIYHALINALSAHRIPINLNMIFYTHVENSPTKTTNTKQHTERPPKQQQQQQQTNKKQQQPHNEFKCVRH